MKNAVIICCKVKKWTLCEGDEEVSAKGGNIWTGFSKMSRNLMNVFYIEKNMWKDRMLKSRCIHKMTRCLL